MESVLISRRGSIGIPAASYCNFAYSALASFRMGMSGSASFLRPATTTATLIP